MVIVFFTAGFLGGSVEITRYHAFLAANQDGI
jgi:hypothetical protein